MDAKSERFKTKKSLGQHFLNNPKVSEWMCDAAALRPDDLAVEVGPGTGALTKELLKRGVKVVALEADERAVNILRETFAAEVSSGQLNILHLDVRTLDVTQLPGIADGNYKVAANIPYYLSGLLFRIFLQSPVQPKTLTYLVQKEVAKRITADTKKGEKESLLSVGVKVLGEPSYVRTVSRGHFTPPPKVDSAIIHIENISRERLLGIEPEAFFAVLHTAFGQKRKQLLGNLAGEYGREAVSHILSTLNLPLSTRAEDVSSEKWPGLVKALLSTRN